ncbi:MAG TPA: maleylpyruvate isomerase family mycothiol-dependent enzyme [Acidimicrobiales bacterium]|nr:maleylpyruvate isomerase family mycothiol-dependent enzyme [Acidimicrobiales bacterium]
MPAASDRDTLVAAVREELDALIALGHELSDGQWATASECPGWTVKDVYSHVIGTELMLLGRPDEKVDVGDAPHLHNEIGEFNEVSVAARRGRSGPDVLAELEQVAAERLAALDAMTQEDFDAESFTPAGQDTYGRFMQIRVFDCWIHEQDVREALGMPGHASGTAVEVSVDEHANGIGFVVGKKAGATEGQSVRFRLTGETERTIDVRVDGRARVVDDLDEPTTTITIPTLLWFRYAAGRRPGDVDHPDVTVEGDEDLGRRVVANAAYTI